MSNKRHKAIAVLWLIPACVWIALILLLSSQTYQQQTIIPLLMKRFNPVQLSERLPDVTIRYGDRVYRAKQQPYVFIEFLFRKTAHFTIYMMMAFLLMLALRPYSARMRRKAVATVVSCLLLSMVDEYVQTFTSARTPLAEDVLIDVAGAASGSLVAATILSRKRRVDSRYSS